MARQISNNAELAALALSIVNRCVYEHPTRCRGLARAPASNRADGARELVAYSLVRFGQKQ